MENFLKEITFRLRPQQRELAKYSKMAFPVEVQKRENPRSERMLVQQIQLCLNVDEHFCVGLGYKHMLNQGIRMRSHLPSYAYGEITNSHHVRKKSPSNVY